MHCFILAKANHIQLLCLLHDRHGTAVVSVLQWVSVAGSDAITYLEQSKCGTTWDDVADQNAAAAVVLLLGRTRNGNAETALRGLKIGR